MISTTLPGSNLRVHLKLENLQPSGSYKDRGISHMIQTLASRGPVSKLITSSGGNAGLAVTMVGKSMGLKVQVFTPETVKPIMVEKFKQNGADLRIGGKNWNEADQVARAALALEPDAKYIPPFDDPLIWDGHSTLVSELAEQLPEPPQAIIASVGGGGLLRGVQLGIKSRGWNTKVLAVETAGAASFAAAQKAGRPVRLEKIDTVASSLGALAVIPSVLDPDVPTQSVVVSDEQAVKACLDFAKEHRMLVEPACGAALALVSSPTLLAQHLQGLTSVAVVVCGGGGVDIDLLKAWQQQFNL